MSKSLDSPIEDPGPPQAAIVPPQVARLADAEALYAQILAEQAGHAAALHRFGMLAIQLARKEEALPPHAGPEDSTSSLIHCRLAYSLLTLGKIEEAIAAFTRGAELDPTCGEIFFGLGKAFQSENQPDKAIDAYRRTLALKPDFTEAHHNLGNLLYSKGLLQDAAAAYHRALQLSPDHLDSLNNLGVTFLAMGRPVDAIAAFRRALELQPNNPLALNNLGNALLTHQQLNEAAVVLEQTVARWPLFAEAWYNLGNVRLTMGHFAAAVDAYKITLEHNPNHIAACSNMGNALQACGRNEEALQAYTEAIRQKPDFVDAYSNAASVLRMLGRIDEARALLRRAIAIRPMFHTLHSNLAELFKDIGLMDNAIKSYRDALVLNAADSVTHSNLAYAVCFHPDYDAGAILRENRLWNELHAVTLTNDQLPFRHDPDPGRRLRIGYVSPDFREHCQAMFMVPLLSRHDHTQFEIFGYASVARKDDFTAQLAGYADTWCDTLGLSDAQVARLVQNDQIDILVDLTMHMSNGRLLLFARKPAPVQVAWLAYPGTTGLSAMDYRLTDPYLDPPGTNDEFYAETSIRLPDTFWCYDPLCTTPMPGPLPVRRKGFITFGCLNNLCKVTPAALALWSRAMTAVPGSHLLLLSPPGSHRQRMVDCLGENGIPPERIEFAAFQPRARYLELYRQIDICLDTFPYNGHTTSLDAFWMGVPVVTRVGQTIVGRAGWSQLCNLNLRELAATNDDDFVKIAAGLAFDLPRLDRLRQELRARMEASPLMNANLFTRNIETAYRQMWQRWCEQPRSER